MEHCLAVKFIYSEKATNFCEISAVDLFYVLSRSASQIYSGGFGKFCGLLRIYELYGMCILKVWKAGAPEKFTV